MALHTKHTQGANTCHGGVVCRTILDLPETRADFWGFFKQHWGPRLAAGKMKVGLFSSQGLSA